MNDLSTYAISIAALFVAALAATGLLVSAADPATPTEPQPVAVHVDTDARALVTMNIAF